jgi:asparagine synthase (glutamine-hydrolysing)
MCSIFGIINSENSEKRGDIIRRMALDQHHRGPDDGDFFENEIAAMGHRRLSIIDLSDAARQPMSSSDGKIVLVFNGEIYNYQILRKNLIELGHTFRTSSDTECIIHLYEEYGKNGFSQLDGMFAIALYDKEKKQVFMLRDRVGKKPLFYFQNSGTLVFASELSALKQHDKMPHELDMQSVSDYL